MSIQNFLSFDSFLLVSSYLIIYFVILVLLVTIILYANNFNFTYISEISQNCFNFFYRVGILCVGLSLTGLPPLLFFFPKFSLLSCIITNSNFIINIGCVLLILFTWFLYLSFLKLSSTQKFYYSGSSFFGFFYRNTFLSLHLVLLVSLLVFGFIFLDDLLLFYQWLFV